MLAEMIKSITDLSQNQEHLRLLFASEKSKTYDRKGTVLTVDLPIPARRHRVTDLESLVAAVEDMAEGLRPSIWVSEDQIVAVLDDGPNSHRLDVVSMSLELSPFFATLRAAKTLDQKQMVELFRHDLCGTTIDPLNTLSLLRNLRFTVNSEQTGTFTAGSAAMGKSVLAEVTGESALPETVTVEFAPYPALRDVVDCVSVITCTLFAYPHEGKLRLVPRPGEIEAAKMTAQHAVKEWISSNQSGTTPVYLGTPN